MNKQQAIELLNKRTHGRFPVDRINEMAETIVSNTKIFTSPETFERDLQHYRQSLMIDPDKYVYLIQEGIEDTLADNWDHFELVDFGDKTLTYKCSLIHSHNGEDVITDETLIHFNKYTGEEIEE